MALQHATLAIRMTAAAAAAIGALLNPSTSAAQITRLSVSATSAQADERSYDLSVSSDGRYVAFESFAGNLVAGDTNGVEDIFVKDRTTGAITRASVTSGGVQVTGRSTRPILSSNGRFVAFTSTAALDPADTDAACHPPGDQDACSDVYLHDTQTGTTTLLTGASAPPAGILRMPRGVTPDGRYVLVLNARWAPNWEPLAAPLLVLLDTVAHTETVVAPAGDIDDGQRQRQATLRDDAKLVIYTASQRLHGAAGDPLSCDAQQACPRLYAFDVEAGTTTRITPTVESLPGDVLTDVRLLDTSADGRFVLAFVRIARVVSERFEHYAAYLHDRTTGGTRRVENVFAQQRVGAVSDDGRTVVTCDSSADSIAILHEGRLESMTGEPFAAACQRSVGISGDGRFVFFDSRLDTLVPGDTNFSWDAFVLDRDRDNDGIATYFETLYGLNPDDPADAALDSDGDGVSNLAEIRAGTHPKGALKRYFAEGAANAFFKTSFNLFNPSSSTTVAHLTFLGQNGQTSTTEVAVAPGKAFTLSPTTDGWPGVPQAPDAAFSTVIETNQLLVAERDMSWVGGGSHAETAIVEPRTEWHFAEGATGPYSLFYLLQNPGDAPARVTIDYLLPAPAAPIRHIYTVDPHSRRTIDINAEPGLASAEVSARLVSDLPILAERAMYISRPGQVFDGGHEGAAVAEPATEWFVAEGATGFFSMYLTVGNPGAADAEIEVTYLLDAGEPIVKRHRATREGRLTIDVAGEDPRLLSATLGAIVRSTNGVPVVVERVMWWPRGDPYEATLTAGSRTTGRRWGVAGARFEPVRGVETYLLIASPTGEAGTVTITLRSQSPFAGPCTATRTLAARTRLTVSTSELCGLPTIATGPLSGTVESTTPIVAERVTYASNAAALWFAGAAVALTKLPDVP